MTNRVFSHSNAATTNSTTTPQRRLPSLSDVITIDTQDGCIGLVGFEDAAVVLVDSLRMFEHDLRPSEAQARGHAGFLIALAIEILRQGGTSQMEATLLALKVARGLLEPTSRRWSTAYLSTFCKANKKERARCLLQLAVDLLVRSEVALSPDEFSAVIEHDLMFGASSLAGLGLEPKLLELPNEAAPATH